LLLGTASSPRPPEQFLEDMRRDLAKYGPVVRAAGIKVE
jgi:hypothetical protein